jgi:hypothetical protein
MEDSMKVEKVATKADVSFSKVQHFSNYKGHPMVRISGNFMGGGFQLSKGKLIAVLANLKELKDFAEGKHDDAIANLKEDEVLKP